MINFKLAKYYNRNWYASSNLILIFKKQLTITYIVDEINIKFVCFTMFKIFWYVILKESMQKYKKVVIL